MSGSTLVWLPADEPRKINPAYGDRAMLALEEFFGPYPITLQKGDLPVLKALSTAAGQRPLDDIVKLVEKYGDIRLWLVDGYNPDKAAISAVVRQRPAGVLA